MNSTQQEVTKQYMAQFKKGGAHEDVEMVDEELVSYNQLDANDTNSYYNAKYVDQE